MASQDQDQALRYIAFDPGDRWVGVALFTLTHKRCYVGAGLYDREREDAYACVHDLRRRLRKDRIIRVLAEDFQIRGRGFNTFGSGQTLRLLGALEYVTLREGRPFRVVPPRPPTALRTLLALSIPIQTWRTTWLPGRPWEHALSAWRVLGQTLLEDHAMLLRQMKNVRQREASTYHLDYYGIDHQAPVQEWSW